MVGCGGTFFIFNEENFVSSYISEIIKKEVCVYFLSQSLTYFFWQKKTNTNLFLTLKSRISRAMR